MARLSSLPTRLSSLLRRHLPAFLVLLALSIVQTWPLTRQLSRWLISAGDPVFQTWTMAWNWHAVTTNPLSIYDANVFYPWRNVLAWSDHLFGQTLLVWPIFALGGNAILASNVSTLLAFSLSGFAMYLLIYDLTGSRIAGLLAGIAYAFAPSRMAHLEHLHLLSAQWPPLMLLCLRRMTVSAGSARRWWAAGLGGCFFAQGLFGIYFLYFSIVMLVIVGGVYLALALWERNRRLAEAVGLAALACALAGVLLVPTLLPYQQIHDDLGIEREVSEVEFWSAERDDYRAVWPRNRLLGDVEPFARHYLDLERALFPGLLVSSLAVVGLFNRRRPRERLVLVAITIGSFVLSLGLTVQPFGREITAPYQLLYDWLPGFRAIRVPARFGVFGLVGLAGLAGLGVDQLVTWSRRLMNTDWQPWFQRLLLTGGLAFLLVETLTLMRLSPELPLDERRADYAWMAEHPAPTLELPMGDGPVASAWPNFWSIQHWNPVANGYSGIVAPTYDLLREAAKTFPDPAFVRFLQGMGIETVVVHGDEVLAGVPDAKALLEGNQVIELVLDGPDSVYRIAPDPWLWRLAEAVPEGETVYLPEVESEPLVFGTLVAILQRGGHTVRGDGVIGSLVLKPAASQPCYAILPPNPDPAQFGYHDAEVVAEEDGYRLLHRRDCSR
jgi:hypothetical protein